MATAAEALQLLKRRVPVVMVASESKKRKRRQSATPGIAAASAADAAEDITAVVGLDGRLVWTKLSDDIKHIIHQYRRMTLTFTGAAAINKRELLAAEMRMFMNTRIDELPEKSFQVVKRGKATTVVYKPGKCQILPRVRKISGFKMFDARAVIDVSSTAVLSL